ncbi:MAG: alpha/beta hydrolase [Spirochaetes bacterium]|jgi:acetyl esterase/lipase|nr:alpha/beta hydrolase [Spirochaetota bacterium]
MKFVKIAVAAAVIIAVVIGTTIFAINTTLFKPSLGSRIARLIVVQVSKQMFSGDNIILSMRDISESMFVPPVPEGVEVERFELAGMSAEWVIAPSGRNNKNKAVLYLHGGGFVSGSCNTHRDLIVRISESAGIPVLAIEYRLAPEHRYRAIISDCVTAYRWLLARGFKPGNIAVGGDSAGASLALMALLSLRDSGTPFPSAVFLMSPVTDLVNLDGESFRTRADVDPICRKENWDKILPALIGDVKTKPAILSPVRQDLTGFPPMLIQVGNDEILLSDSVRLAERAKKCGVDVTIQIWDDMWHVFQQSAGINPEARQAIRDIGNFLKKHL